jgi:GNAT superfamily N-acetyltransferase
LEFRAALESDLPGEYAVFVAAEEELHSRSGRGLAAPYDRNGGWAQTHRHLFAHDERRMFVAEKEGRVLGFAAAFVRADCWFLSALFVHPDHQGKGIGRQLLELAWDESARRRLTVTEAIQPVSTGLYAKRGMLPVSPVLRLSGVAEVPRTFVAIEPIEPSSDALRTIDLAAYGFDRSVDHEFWGRTSTRSTLWAREGEPCAYSYRGLFGIGPVAGCDGNCAAQALAMELAHSQGDHVRVDIPGSATALVEVALAGGLRIAEVGLLLFSPANEPPPSALAIHSYWLL